MTKLSITTLILVLTATLACAQTSPVKVPNGANLFYYQTLEYGESIDTQYTIVETGAGGTYLITDLERLQRDYTPGYIPDKDYIQGYSVEDIIVSELADSLYTLTTILANPDARWSQTQEGSTAIEHYLTVAPFTRSDIHFETEKVGGLTRYTCSINSNKLEFYIQPYSRDITPLPHYGRFHKGLLVSYWRNGQCQLRLTKAEKNPSYRLNTPPAVSDAKAHTVTPRELNNIKRDRMIITTRIFDSVQLSWGKKSAHIKGDAYLNIPDDTVLHYAGGTLALRRLSLPALPSHYQTFVEIHQRSNGDAYDRTGSLFVVPLLGRDENFVSFFRGINQSPDSLPIFTDRQGLRYQGIRIEGDTTPYRTSYYPPLELVRFFTSFGVGHFNDRVRLDGLTWEDENYYKQEVTELTRWLQGDVLIGIWIGNYDGGGHIVTVDLKSYPGDFSGKQDGHAPFAKPLFNTCNVLEMAGQNYGRLFGTDSLSATFYLPANVKNTRLRYITTGHGGWDGGDEFNPKPNTIIIDGQPRYTYTPWRCDCGRYRQYNPVSGNFWNGLSSSDYSRSGWCPGTATQPTYFDLNNLAPGIHTITIAIPQGESQEGSFSHWSVSGALLFEP